MCSLGIEPTTFALLTQCSTTEPQEHYIVCIVYVVNKTVRLLHSYRDTQNMHDSYLNRLLLRNVYKY